MSEETGEKTSQNSENKENPELQSQLEQTQRTNEALQRQINELQNVFTDPERLKALVGVSSTPTLEKFDPSTVTDDQGNVDVDGLYKGIVKTVEGSVGASSEAKMAGLARQVDILASTVQVEQARAKYPDFDQYTDAMIALSKQVAGATPEHLYKLARADAGLEALSEKKQAKQKEAEAGASASTGESTSIPPESLRDSEGKPLEGKDLTRALLEKLSK